jgi:large subunit ribosomal protein L23
MGLFGTSKTEDKTAKTDQKKSTVVEGIKKTTKVKKNTKKSDSDIVGSGYGVIMSPIVTEKAHIMSKNGKYLFKVFPKSTKKEIKEAIERMYQVEVMKVNSSIVAKKKRTIKYNKGYQKTYKKAVITLKSGQHIAAFEGV